MAGGILEDPTKVGVIMEYSGKGISEELARSVVEDMVRESMRNHGYSIREVLISSASTTVTTGFSSLISAVTLW